MGLLGSKYYQNEERSKTNPLVYGRKRENQWYQSGKVILIAPLLGITKRTASDLSTIRTASNVWTIQCRLMLKGQKSLEYWCLVIHLTSVSTISYAESNGDIFILIALLGITNTRTNAVRVICQQYVLRAICQQYKFAWFSKAINP
jgi:hypothetical protein